MSLNKKELIREISERTNLSQKQATEALDAFVELVPKELSQGRDVRLMGFGTFTTRVRPAREALVPNTGEKVNVPEKRVPAFKPGKYLKEKVNF